jgi:hypothetical protein
VARGRLGAGFWVQFRGGLAEGRGIERGGGVCRRGVPSRWPRPRRIRSERVTNLRESGGGGGGGQGLGFGIGSTVGREGGRGDGACRRGVPSR